MGGINDFVLTPDSVNIISVAQDRKITVWGAQRNDPIFAKHIDDNEEALTLTM